MNQTVKGKTAFNCKHHRQGSRGGHIFANRYLTWSFLKLFNGPQAVAILAGTIHPVGYQEFLVDETQMCI